MVDESASCPTSVRSRGFPKARRATKERTNGIKESPWPARWLDRWYVHRDTGRECLVHDSALMCGSGLVVEGQMTPQPVTVGAPPGTGHPLCKVCGGNGARLSATEIVCPGCAWLRPLAPGYQMDKAVFLWAQDGQAMSKLQSITALHTVVRNVSDKVGRPWIESTFNAIKLGPRQFVDVWNLAVLAARILGLPKMPDVYISGDQMWNTYTYGTENSSFIVLGTSHLINFAGDELLFVLAREMGHCRAGHALWNTVLRFVAGDVSVHTGLLSNGLINAINPTKLIQGAIDLPLMAWSRQSDITADRAGLMAVGDEALVRRVLLAWSIRSARLLQQVNIEEWLKQESASDDSMTKFSEMTTSSSMYTTRRLRLLGQAAHETELMRWSQSIQPVRQKLAPVPTQAMPGLGVGTVKAVKAAVTRPTVPSAGVAPVGASAPLGARTNDWRRTGSRGVDCECDAVGDEPTRRGGESCACSGAH